MRRWIAGVLIMMLTMSSTAPVARAQSTPLIGGGLTALPTQSLGPNLVQNPGFETAGPAGWPAGGGWSLDQLPNHGGVLPVPPLSRRPAPLCSPTQSDP